MHRSEGVIGCREAMQRYDYVELAGIDLRPEHMEPVELAGAYLSRRMFAPAGEAIRFAEIAAISSLEAHSHRSTLRRTAVILEPEWPFDAFMDHVLKGVDERQTLFERLAPYSISREFASSP